MNLTLWQTAGGGRTIEVSIRKGETEKCTVWAGRTPSQVPRVVLVINSSRADKDVATELIDGFKREGSSSDATIISANAKTFCLLIRQVGFTPRSTELKNLLESQITRLNEEIELYQVQSEKIPGTKAFSEEEQIHFLVESQRIG